MEINSFAIKVKKEPTAISLFAGVGGLCTNLQKSIKSGSVHFSKLRDTLIWKKLNAPENIDEVYFPVWEDELEANLKDTKNSLKELILDNLNTEEDIRLTKAYLYRKIIRYFRQYGCPCKKDFIGGIEVYIKEADEGTNYWTYQRYGLTIRYNDQIKDGWQLDITQGSKSLVGKTPIYLLQSLQDEQFRVIAGTMILKKSEIGQHHMEATNGKIYPIVNHSIKSGLKIPTHYHRDGNKYVTKYNGIRNFISKWINIPAFTESVGVDLPNNAHFIQLAEEKINIVEEKAKMLRFGNNQTNVSPGYCFKRFGAAERPTEHRHFFICPRSQNFTLWRLYYIFQQGKDSKNAPKNRLSPDDIDTNNYLYHTIWMGNHAWANGMNFMFSDDEHALAELENHLTAMNFEHDKKYFAIIISDVDRDDVSSPHYHLYYDMKYLLMKYNIGSQVIHKKRVDENSFINYMVPNIAAAIAGKEGGKAWKIAYPSQENDMIVGIGAYREHGINQQYIGSAVCLDKEGELHNFDACLKGNFEELRATLIKAILNFYGKFKHPSRLIIYYHKKLNREESDIIEDALRTCQVSCPVIVIHVTETDNEDLMAFDTSCTNVLMPVSGTYIHLRTRKACHEYLLYNNERYGGFGEKMPFLRPFPVKISIMPGRRNKKELTEQDVKEIVTLTYQTTRINWKSVSMRSMPITIAYAALVAKFVPHFPNGQLTEFGKNNLWML